MAIFIAGGDHATYVQDWTNIAVAAALHSAWRRGAVGGGTSAGCAILGAHVFSAANGTVYSDEALADPYNPYMTLGSGVVAPPPLAHAITDTHFRQRDRLGRLVALTARLITGGDDAAPLGIGVDEATALLVDAAGNARVVGDGAVTWSRRPRRRPPAAPVSRWCSPTYRYTNSPRERPSLFVQPQSPSWAQVPA